jgi:hypothetical protein
VIAVIGTPKPLKRRGGEIAVIAVIAVIGEKTLLHSRGRLCHTILLVPAELIRAVQDLEQQLPKSGKQIKIKKELEKAQQIAVLAFSCSAAKGEFQCQEAQKTTES